mmetsp:Transcript_20425/g.57715  ORF Transcript_20425/g.57715 Transcript_20425/m.57715 type:complete len:383 (+) Transcript_20425:83-1231(+)
MVCVMASTAAAVATADVAAAAHDEAPVCERLDEESQVDSGDERTPTTTASECSEAAREEELDSIAAKVDLDSEGVEVVPQLRPGLFPSEPPAEDVYGHGSAWRQGVGEDGDGLVRPFAPAPDGLPDAMYADSDETVPDATDAGGGVTEPECDIAGGDTGGGDAAVGSADAGEAPAQPFGREETLFLFDWDDTVLPSTWIQRHGLRLDEGSSPAPWQRHLLAEVASVASETLRLAKQRGTVVLVTNAERGWIELSCNKFLPGLAPAMEGVKLVSARTSYEGPGCVTPLDWKISAFQAEIASACGGEALADISRRKNIHSLGDSIHEREALLRAAAPIHNCRSKSLKFVERPDPPHMRRWLRRAGEASVVRESRAGSRNGRAGG